MFRLITNKQNQWRMAAQRQVISVAGNVPGTNSKSDMGSKNKNKGAAKPAPTFVPDNTPVGQKKDMKKPMNDAYHPKSVEAAWYSWWEHKKFFSPDAKKA
mmetsp:Transcript_28761/g.20824  ORF Transcript_28761/g.20824 Transcript_28761/m.20824 type:complete len:100 (-) Transcript_28761:2878-3177(-)